MRRIALGTAGAALLCLCVFFGGVALYIGRSEVWPAIRLGSLNVETDSMVLNILWEGNEIYFLLLVYVLLAIGLAFGAFNAFRAAIRHK